MDTKRPTVFAVFAIALLSPALGIAQVSSADCLSVLRLAGYNYSEDVERSSFLDDVFDAQCRGSSSSSASNLAIGIDAIVEAIPVKFKLGGGTTRQKLDSFCQTYQRNTRATTETSHLELSIAPGAYEAFNACILHAASGINVRAASPSPQKVNVSIYPPPTGIIVAGVDIGRGLVCTGQTRDGALRSSALSPQGTIKLPAGDFLAMLCTRSSRKVADPTGLEADVYDSTTITLGLSQYHNISIPIAGVGEYLDLSAERIRTELAEIRAGMQRVEAGSVSQGSDQPPAESHADCDPARIYEFPVVFKVPFREAPTISLGLGYLDSGVQGPIRDYTVRVKATAQNVGPTGFSVRVESWCRSHVWGSRFDWVAVGR